jgi:hypothetical protein
LGSPDPYGYIGTGQALRGDVGMRLHGAMWRGVEQCAAVQWSAGRCGVAWRWEWEWGGYGRGHVLMKA